MIYKPTHSNTSLADWRSFCKDVPSFRFGQVIDRSELKIPDHLVPLARGAAIPSDALLDRCCPWLEAISWRSASSPDFLTFTFGFQGLFVQKFGDLWTIGRWGATEHTERLVFVFGSTLICTRDQRDAKNLAWFGWNEGFPAHGLFWIRDVPEDYQQAIEWTRQRAIDDAACVSNVPSRAHVH
jgi:hypothetical protein